MNHGQSQCFLQVCFSNNCHLGLWMNHHFLQYTQNGGFSTSMFSYEGMDWFQQVLESLISWLTSFSPRLWLSNPGISSHNMTGYCICSTAKTCQCLDSYWTLQDIAHGKRSAWKLKRNWSVGIAVCCCFRQNYITWDEMECNQPEFSNPWKEKLLHKGSMNGGSRLMDNDHPQYIHKASQRVQYIPCGSETYWE